MKKPVKKREKKYRPMDALARSLQSKHGKWLAANDAPMNSRLNEGRLAARFAPILCVFKEMEETGESMVNQKNEVVYRAGTTRRRLLPAGAQHADVL